MGVLARGLGFADPEVLTVGHTEWPLAHMGKIRGCHKLNPICQNTIRDQAWKSEEGYGGGRTGTGRKSVSQEVSQSPL